MSSYTLVTAIYKYYKTRLVIVELVDRWNNLYFIRYVTGLEVGDLVPIYRSGLTIDSQYYIGSQVCCKNLEPGEVISSIKSLVTYKNIATANGTYCIVKDYNYEHNTTTVILPSKIVKYISGNNTATIGRVGYEKSFMEIVGKAGTRRSWGVRPTVRGVAMNPVDHPHGGRTKTNSPEKSPWSWVAKHNK